MAGEWPRSQPAPRERIIPPPGGWGQAPTLGLVGALGLLLVALADTAARYGATWDEALFWGGLILLYAPIAARLAARSTTHREAGALVTLLGLGLYLVKVMHSPLGFTHHDEFLHWRTAQDILRDGRLFGENALLPISPLYPGLEQVTTALVSLGGLPIFVAGVIVAGLARLVLVLALYLFYAQIGGSPRLAGLATALYVANPTAIFFGGMFKYETLALAFFGLTLWLTLRRERAGPVAERAGLTVGLLLVLAATVVTHHLTAYILLGVLILWMIAGWLLTPGGAGGPRLGGVVLLAIVLNVAWLFYVASVTLGYLAPLLTSAVVDLMRLIARESGGRELFTSASGEVAPLWQRMTALAAVGLLLLGLPVGLVAIWRHHRQRPAAVTLAALALAYPATLALRLAGDARSWEVSQRSSAFLFMGLGFVVALAVDHAWLARRPGWLATLPVAAAATVILVGSLIAGWPPQWHLPRAYLVSAHTRSIEPEGIAAALWARDALGLDNRVVTDSTNYLLMGSYGEQHYVTTLSGGIDASWVMFAPELGPAQIAILRQGRVRFVVADYRVTTARAMLPVYPGDHPLSLDRRQPLDRSLLEKFDRAPLVSRVFDSGNIVIYDVGALTGVS